MAYIYRKYLKEARKLDEERKYKVLLDNEQSQELISKIHKEIRTILHEDITNLELHKLKLIEQEKTKRK